MLGYTYKNITKDTITKLIDVVNFPFIVETLRICNVSGTGITFDLYIESQKRNVSEKLGDTAEPDKLPVSTYYLYKTVRIDSGEAKVLQEHELCYDISLYNLMFVATGNTDVILVNKDYKYNYSNPNTYKRNMRSRSSGSSSGSSSSY